MELMTYFKLQPSILTIAPTYKCTAACKHCCFRCTPKIDVRLDVDLMHNYIDEAVNSFKTLKGVVFTGGECFVLADELPSLIERATSYNLFTRVVSNGYWATTLDNAIEKLRPLVNAGLKEINFSTGDNHQKFVSLKNIINGIRAAHDLGIRSMCISIETDPCVDINYTLNEIKNIPDLSLMINNNVLHIINGAWMHFNKKDEKSVDIQGTFQEYYNNNPCENIFDNIFINPHSQMLSCCGITVEYNKYLKVGNLLNNSILDLYREQCNDLFKIWLHVEGPVAIYNKVIEITGKKKEIFSHKCAYCLELIRTEENIEVIKELIRRELPHILYKYEMRKKMIVL